MKKIAVIGLGIIGASLGGALTRAGYAVYGTDQDAEAVKKAILRGYIAGEAKRIAEFDAVFIAVPPKATVKILDETPFKDGAFVADICGVKEPMEKTVYSRPRAYRYIGLHPMAGKETSGIDAASVDLFENANLIITVCSQTEESAKTEATSYATALGFGKIVVCSAKEHDKKIALTSQLAHIVSNAYVKSEEISGCEGFTGGSFQDMTRIAGVDERVWTQLYAANRGPILSELTRLIDCLNEYKHALQEEDDKTLCEALRAGRLVRERIKRKED
ncbi:MAG: prephenate dehydrogenase [Clostridia bacterium]|nr:prephenate dehydrogenase [Clostridia bacterium]